MSAEQDAAFTLGNAIAEAALRAGIYNGEVPLSGPQLLQLCEDMANSIVRLRGDLDSIPTWLRVALHPDATPVVLISEDERGYIVRAGNARWMLSSGERTAEGAGRRAGEALREYGKRK